MMLNKNPDIPAEVNFYYVAAALIWLAMTLRMIWQAVTGNIAAVSMGDVILWVLLWKIGRLGRRVRKTYEVCNDE